MAKKTSEKKKSREKRGNIIKKPEDKKQEKPTKKVEKNIPKFETVGKKERSFLSKNKEKITSLLFGILGIAVVLSISLIWIPNVYDNTETAKQEKINSNMEKENETIEEKSKVVLKTNFGDIKIDLKPDAAPLTAESFLRLSFRDLYDNTKFHRMVKDIDFSVIQGGDYEKGNGTGGQSAFGGTLKDEIWSISPQFSDEGELLNYEFTDPSLYSNFDEETGYVTYKKGLIVMANSGANTAGSQFFITLKDTNLPASYTAFGIVKTESFSTLDKIYNEVTPQENGIETTDGEPSQEIKLKNVKIVE